MRVDATDLRLIKAAVGSLKNHKALKSKKLATVGCALLTAKGNTYTGVSMDFSCGIGFCAEHSAVAEMVKGGETAISRIAAVLASGKVIPPCGRCRELIYQVNRKNNNCAVIISNKEKMKLSKLMPLNWQKACGK